MRELKFRAWDKEQKKMLYGVSIGTIKIWDENAPIISHEFSYSEDCVFEQFTGLKDCDGEDIYEGDIVKWKHTYAMTQESKEYVERVYWEEKDASFVVGDWFEPLGHLVDEDEVEVIGNIHENPELLNKEDE